MSATLIVKANQTVSLTLDLPLTQLVSIARLKKPLTIPVAKNRILEN